jgi:hypothetical protein
MTQDDERDELWKRLVCGEVDADDAQVRARAAARELDELLRLKAGLDGSAADQRAALRAAEAGADPRDRALVEARLRTLAQQRATAGTFRRRSARFHRLLLAAAIVVVGSLLAIALWPRERASRPERPMLSGAPLVDVAHPADGAVYDATAGFGWSYPRAADERFEFVLEDASGNAPPFRTTVDATPWIPTSEQRTGWPTRARWSVRVLDSNDTVRAASKPRAVSFE